MIDDAQLLRRYADEKSEEAFAELVQRHVGLVYACALRRVGGDASLAEEVTQQVFTDVARRASALARRPVLAGWLFTSTRFAASKALRTARRRLQRDQEAYLMQETLQETAVPIDWEKARPVLDDVIAELNERDREAILLRYFEARDFAAVGARLNVNDNTARMRVERALDKLRAKLEHRGIASSAAALATALAQQTAVAVPAGLATNVTVTALAAGTLAGGSLATYSAALIAFMSPIKLQIALAGAVLVATGTGFLIQAQDIAKTRSEIATLQRQNQQWAVIVAENERLKTTAAEVALLQQDDAALARLRDEATNLRARFLQTSQAKTTSRSEKAAPTSRQVVSEKVGEGLQKLKGLHDKKDWPGMMALVDGLIAQVPPTSFDMAYLLDLKAKVYLQQDEYAKAIEPWETALKLAEEHGYFDAKTRHDIATYVGRLRLGAGRTSTLESPDWF